LLSNIPIHPEEAEENEEKQKLFEEPEVIKFLK
jgi:hypothetical protein